MFSFSRGIPPQPLTPLTAADLNNWFPMYKSYWYKAHKEWIDTHFTEEMPSRISFRSPLKVLEIRYRTRYAYHGWKRIEIKEPIYRYFYPYDEVPDWLNPHEVNYSCTYDHYNLLRMRSHNYRTRSKYLRR